MNLPILDLADADLLRGFRFYQRKSGGVGWYFLDSLYAEIESLRLYAGHIRFDYGAEEYRLGYYIIGQKAARKGKWVWGQYCPLIPKEDFEAIISQAMKRGWLGK